MRDYRSCDAATAGLYLPIVFLSNWHEEYKAFMESYDPKVGFFISKNKKDYYLYQGGYQYKLALFEQRHDIVAFRIAARDNISQKATITMATDSVRVKGLGRDYFILHNQWNNFAHDHPRVNFRQCLKRLDALLNSKTSKESRKVDPMWQKLAEISEKKREFSSHFLIEWRYTGFAQGDKVEDGYLYTFEIAAPDATIRENEARFDVFRRENDLLNEDDESDQSLEALRERYVNTLNAGTIIEIPLNRPQDQNGKQPMLYGTVKRLELPGVTHTQDGEAVELEETFFSQDAYFCRPWTMLVFFKDDATVSAKDIATTNGVIMERVSTDYLHYKSTLSAMTNPIANQNWSAAEQVLVSNHIDPCVPGKPLNFYSKNLNDNQKEAIQMAVDAQDFCLIQGPPGTGKTTIITEMIRHFIAQGQRVLVCSKGNLAVDNVLEKWIKENKDRSDGHLCVRLGEHYKLDFLKDFTPANVTERVQEQAYTKTRQERDFLISQVQQQIDLVDKHKNGIGQMADWCAQICQLTDALKQLCEAYEEAIPRYKRRAGILCQKAEHANLVYSGAYHGLMLPCYRLLRSADAPSTRDIAHFDQGCRIIAQQLPAAMAAFRPGFFARLLAGKKGNHWVDLEKEVSDRYAAFLAMNMQSCNLQGNSLSSVAALQLPDLGDTPAPHLLFAAVESLQLSLDKFAQQEMLRLNRIRTVLNDWLTELGSGVSSPLEKHVVLDSIPVIGSTCMGIMSDSDFNSVTYDVVIVDEAGQIPIFDILVPIIKAKKVVLIGDHLQLPPMDENDFARYYAVQKTGATKGEDYENCQQAVAQWYNVSLFEKLYCAPGLNHVKTMLNTQYRMHPDISQFISENFYQNKYIADDSTKKRNLQIAGFSDPIYFYDTCKLPAQVRGETNHNPGYSNEVEAELLSDILVKLILAVRADDYSDPRVVIRSKEDGTITGYDIGVISGYKKQVKAIYSLTRQKLEQHMPVEEAQMHMDRFMISSVDSFQGRDNQIILFSMTRSNPDGKIGFLKDVRRLNVAMTRAKSLLIMVGDSATLTACDAACAHDSDTAVSQIYQNLVAYCTNKNYYHPLKGGDGLGAE